MLKSCQKCSKEFKCKPSEDRLFCSRQCWKENCEQNRTYECTFCQCKFQIKPEAKRRRGQPFCSTACYGKYQTGENNHAWKGIQEDRHCEVCNKTFLINTTKRKNVARFCSNTCKGVFYTKNGLPSFPKNKKIETECDVCKKTIKRIENKNKRNFCSKGCASKGYSLYNRGENGSGFVHGNAISPYPPGWTSGYRESIRQRDSNKCRLCGSSKDDHKTKLHVHHIDNIKTNLNVSNLITLCVYCHAKVHGNKKQKELWEKTLSDLLKE